MLELNTPLEALPSVGPKFWQKFKRLGLDTVQDLLFNFPVRYEDFSEIYRINDLEPGQQATIQGIVEEVDVRHTWKKNLTIVEARIRDESGSIRAVWFNQPYVKNVLRPGKLANFSGKVSVSEEDIYLSHPTYELVSFRETRHTARLVPVYPETKGLTSKGIRFVVQPVLANLEPLSDWLPEEIRRSRNYPALDKALHDIHFPNKMEDAEQAQKRFAFEDLFLLQLLNLRQKLKLAQEKAPPIEIELPELKKLLGYLPFELTPSQKRSLWEVVQDIARPRPMNRLLQGDVGSGKTAVAALAAIVAARKGYQTAVMAPTEVLAGQHFETFRKLLKRLPQSKQPALAIMTAHQNKIVYESDLELEIKKKELQQAIKKGEAKIIIGTHALIQKSVSFKKLGLVVIDEQHRFGVDQRAKLSGCARLPDGQGQSGTDTQTDAEKGDCLLHEDLTFQIRKALFAVRKNLGLGHKEIIYQKALEQELVNAKIDFSKEKTINILYGNKKIGTYRPDFVIEDRVIVELKCLPFLGAMAKKQIWTYLKGSSYRVALLANFSPSELEIERVVYDKARDNSASSLRLSALIPHFLSMSATPIPRTLMLTVFGDLDISTIDELPAGRKPILTKIVSPENRTKAYGFIKGQIQKGRQAFVICPRIEPPQTDADRTQTGAENFPRGSAYVPHKSALLWEVKSVKEEYQKLKERIFPEFKVAMLHGQLKSAEKEQIMKDFRQGRTDILVSTSVIEVGVDVPNATIMMIEGADRFGLAQLYQFRGRVGRGEHQSFCFLFADSKTRSTSERLKAIVTAKSGFELAERDLELRGPGEFIGQKQTGLPDIAMRGLQDAVLIRDSRQAAVEVLKKHPSLEAYPLLKAKADEFQSRIHLE